MKIVRRNDIYLTKVERDGFQLCKMATLIDKSDSKDFILKYFRLDSGASTDFHSHFHEQMHFIVQGSGVVSTGRERINVEQGDSIIFHSNDPHSFENTSQEVFEFLAIIKNE